MNEIKLTLQENEVRAVFQLIDVAVKSQVFKLEAILYFNKLQEQAKEQWSEPIEKEESKEEEAE